MFLIALVKNAGSKPKSKEKKTFPPPQILSVVRVRARTRMRALATRVSENWSLKGVEPRRAKDWGSFWF